MHLSIRVSDKLIVDSDFAKNEIIKLLNLKKKSVFNLSGIDKKYLDQNKNDFFIDNFDYKNYF